MELIDQEKKVQQTWTEKLTEEVAKAEMMALQIREKVLLPDFTLVKMAEIMRISRHDAEQKIKFLAKFGYMENKSQGGVMFYRIISEPSQRLLNIEGTKAKTEEQYLAQIEYLTALQEITSNYLPKE